MRKFQLLTSLYSRGPEVWNDAGCLRVKALVEPVHLPTIQLTGGRSFGEEQLSDFDVTF